MKNFFILLVQVVVTLCVTAVWTYSSIEAKAPVSLDPTILGVVVVAWGLKFPWTTGAGSK